MKAKRRRRSKQHTLFTLVNYFDVWGNEDDGWEVNNLCNERENLRLSNNATQADVLALLKGVGFIQESVTLEEITFSIWDRDMIELEQASDGRPICRLEAEV